MMQPGEVFLKKSESIAFDESFRKKTTDSIHNYQEAFKQNIRQYSNLELARHRASYTKWKVTENLDKYLIEFEATFMRKGGKVVWAHDAATAVEEVKQIIDKTGSKTVLKSKTMVGEEIDLSNYLKKHGITIKETDIGDFILDAAQESPFHMVTPAMHKSKQEISALLNTTIGSSLDAGAQELSNDIRQELRKDFIQSEVVITGANFLIADAGMVAITENEGNTRMGIAFAKTHIVLAGIEKILPSLNDLDLFWPLLANYGTGQNITSYNTLIGPKDAAETDGAQDLIVVLIDNGRSELLSQADQRQALSCIKCGACLNVCPVFKTIGGQTYDTTYTGPIGSVVTPYLKGLNEYKHLSYASTLCGSCTDICPVKIDLHNHLLRNRRDAMTKTGKDGEKMLWYTWKKMMLNRKTLNRGANIKNFMLRSFFKSEWGERREFPKVVEKSFNQLWRERNGS